MIPQILATKLYAPRPHSNRVSRPRLLEQLNETWHHKLTLISAPAGFGKTTLLGEWLQTSAHPVSWFSLDRSDDHLNRFLSYLVAAMRLPSGELGSEAQAMLRSGRFSSAEPLLSSLLNEVDEHPSHGCLILDDYHLIETQAIHDALHFLLDRAPP